MKPFLFYFLTLWGILWIQMANHHYLGGLGVSVDVIFIVVLYFGLTRGPLSAQLLGFVWGLLIDAAALGTLGEYAFLLAGTGYLSGMLRRQLDESKIWTQSIFSGTISILYLMLSLGLERLFSGSHRPFSGLLWLQPLVHAVVAPFIFALMQWWCSIWALFPEER